MLMDFISSIKALNHLLDISQYKNLNERNLKKYGIQTISVFSYVLNKEKIFLEEFKNFDEPEVENKLITSDKIIKIESKLKKEDIFSIESFNIEGDKDIYTLNTVLSKELKEVNENFLFYAKHFTISPYVNRPYFHNDLCVFKFKKGIRIFRISSSLEEIKEKEYFINITEIEDLEKPWYSLRFSAKTSDLKYEIKDQFDFFKEAFVKTHNFKLKSIFIEHF